MKIITVEVESISPLLMNRFRDSQIEGASKKRTGAQKEMVVEDKLYLTGKNEPYIPANYFRGSIVQASKSFKIAGKGKSTYSSLVGSSINIIPEAIVITGGYVPYRIAAVNPMTKKARRGRAWLGKAWLGLAGRGTAWIFNAHNPKT
jgi:hypothetical protein